MASGRRRGALPNRKTKHDDERPLGIGALGWARKHLFLGRSNGPCEEVWFLRMWASGLQRPPGSPPRPSVGLPGGLRDPTRAGNRASGPDFGRGKPQPGSTISKPHGIASEFACRAENRCKSRGAAAGDFPKPLRDRVGPGTDTKSTISGPTPTRKT